ncbi:MAG: Ig-like domain-containing protein [Gemmatimonadota bacterium]|nr:Ig-like domain-containing protein [Gemmatimonadota bacterium]
MEISAPSTSVELGQKLLLSATVKDASGQRLRNVQVSWTSSDPAVAEVAEGMVTGRSPGHVYVRATAGAARDSMRVTVESPPVGEIVVRPDTLYLIRGRVGRLFVEVRDPAGRPMANSLLFSSSAPEIAPVSDSGEVQGVALGSAAVTVTAGLRSVQVPVRVVTGERYSVTYLGTLGGMTPYRHSYMASREHLARVRVLSAVLSSAHDVNNRGEVVGGAVTAAGQWHAYLWRGGRMTDLGAPPGLAWSEAWRSMTAGLWSESAACTRSPPPSTMRRAGPGSIGTGASRCWWIRSTPSCSISTIGARRWAPAGAPAGETCGGGPTCGRRGGTPSWRWRAPPGAGRPRRGATGAPSTGEESSV